MRKPILLLSAVGLLTVLAAWMIGNPSGGFGLSVSQLTTFNRLPVPLADLQVRTDGTMRMVGKSHQIPVEQLAWLAKPQPEVLIIASGWQGDARPAGPLQNVKGTKILTMRTGQALELFNTLWQQGVRVAIHVHSGC